MDYSHRFAEAFRSVRLELVRLADRARHLVRHSDPWAVAGWVIGGLLLAAALLPVGVILVIAIGFVALVMGWLHEFVFLMGLSDKVLPGRHDKLVWIALFVLVPPVGAVAFWMYRHACWPSSKPSPWSGDDDRLA